MVLASIDSGFLLSVQTLLPELLQASSLAPNSALAELRASVALSRLARDRGLRHLLGLPKIKSVVRSGQGRDAARDVGRGFDAADQLALGISTHFHFRSTRIVLGGEARMSLFGGRRLTTPEFRTPKRTEHADSADCGRSEFRGGLLLPSSSLSSRNLPTNRYAPGEPPHWVRPLIRSARSLCRSLPHPATPIESSLAP